jgi:hypothetical protein
LSQKKFLIAYAIGALVLLLGSGTYRLISDGAGGGSVDDEPAVRSVARGAQLHDLPEDQPSPATPDSTAVVDEAPPSPVPAPPVAAPPAPRAAAKVPVPQAPVAAAVDPSTSTTFGGGRYEGPSAPNPVPRAPTGNPGFEITCDPVVKMILPEADSDGCSILSVGGFSGTVALACLDAPAGLNCYTDSQITLAAGATEGFHLTMTNEAPHGTYTLRIVGTSGALSDTVPIEFHSVDSY